MMSFCRSFLLYWLSRSALYFSAALFSAWVYRRLRFVLVRDEQDENVTREMSERAKFAKPAQHEIRTRFGFS